MNKLSLYFFVFLLFGGSAVFAGGLENVIVEKYYVADANDAAATNGKLPAGAVTYRIFVDLAPGYTFQSVYGSPTHQLSICSTTPFYNVKNGAKFANGIPKGTLINGTIMLDSWLSVGAGAAETMGVLKSEDDGVNTIVNSNTPQILQNADPSSGVPLKKQDGLIAGAPKDVTAFGIDQQLNYFLYSDTISDQPAKFITSNGAWACLGKGVQGVTKENRVLIAQITTKGKLTFELNIQIGKPEGGVEQYVAKNPEKQEILAPFLTYPAINNKKQ